MARTGHRQPRQRSMGNEPVAGCTQLPPACAPSRRCAHAVRAAIDCAMPMHSAPPRRMASSAVANTTVGRMRRTHAADAWTACSPNRGVRCGRCTADGPKLEIMRSAHSAAPGFSASPVFSPHGVATSRWRASDGEPTSRCWRSRCRDAWSIRHSTDSIAWSSGTRSSLERRIDHRCVPRWLGRARRMVNVVAWFPSPWFPPPWLPRVASVDVSAGTSR